MQELSWLCPNKTLLVDTNRIWIARAMSYCYYFFIFWCVWDHLKL